MTKSDKLYFALGCIFCTTVVIGNLTRAADKKKVVRESKSLL